MRDRNIVSDLSQKLNSPEQARADMNEAMALITGMFRERYIGRMNEALSQYMDYSRADPPKEATLLRSMMPFMANDTHENLERTAELFTLIDAFRRLSQDSQESVIQSTQSMQPPHDEGNSKKLTQNDNFSDTAVREQKDDTVVHSDGVYELDEQCLSSRTKPPRSAMTALLPGMLMLSLARR